MAEKLTDRTGLVAPATNDLMHVVDVSDTTDSAEGTSKKMDIGDLTQVVSGADTVLVQEKGDFPTPSGGVITLTSGTIYNISGVVSTGTDRINTNGASGLFGTTGLHDQLTYTGTGSMFTTLDNTLILRELTLVATAGTVFDFTSTDAGDSLICTGIVFASQTAMGNVDGCDFFVIDRCDIRNTTSAGFTFTGATNGSFTVIAVTSANVGTLFSLGTSVWNDVSIRNTRATTPSGSTFLNGATASGNIATGSIGRIDSCTFLDSGTPVATIDSATDVQWSFTGNAGMNVQDTIHAGSMFFTGNATDTVIASSGVYVKVAGTTTSSLLRQFTSPSSNELQHDGIDTRLFTLFANMAIEKSGTAVDALLAIFVDGSIITTAGPSKGNISSTTRSVSLSGSFEMATSKSVEIFIQNVDNDNDLLVTDLELNVTAA